MRIAEPADLRQLPAARLAELRGVIGAEEVARWCAALLTGQVGHNDPELPPLTWLGGASAAALVEDGVLPAQHEYWARVWAARGLLHVWRPDAAPAVVAAMRDEAWRVREMAAKVVRRWEVGEAAEAAAALVDDPVPRVRAAAVRALGVVGEGEEAAAVRSAMDDPDAEVRRAAGAALHQLASRLDRPL